MKVTMIFILFEIFLLFAVIINDRFCLFTLRAYFCSLYRFVKVMMIFLPVNFGLVVIICFYFLIFFCQIASYVFLFQCNAFKINSINLPAIIYFSRQTQLLNQKIPFAPIQKKELLQILSFLRLSTVFFLFFFFSFNKFLFDSI